MTSELEALIQRFRELTALERDAHRLYKSLLPLVSEPKDKHMLQGIMADELRHAQYAEEIVALLEQS